MHMNIATVVMPVRLSAYKGLVAGEMLGAKLLAQRLRLVYGQAVVYCVPWGKADNVVMAFYIFPPQFSVDSRIFTTRLRWGVLYYVVFHSYGVTSFLAA